MKPYAEKFYKSKAWKDCRNSYIRSVGYLCEQCLKNGKYVAAAEVHHIKHITPYNINDPDITLSHDNLIALCKQCHALMHVGEKNKRYVIGDDGQVIPLLSQEQ